MLILAIYTKLELYPHPVDLLMVHSVSFFGIHLQSRLDASIILSYPVSLLFPYWVYNSIILLVFPSHVERDDLAKVSLPGIAMLSLSRGWRFNPHPHTPQLLYTQTKKKKGKGGLPGTLFRPNSHRIYLPSFSFLLFSSAFIMLLSKIFFVLSIVSWSWDVILLQFFQKCCASSSKLPTVNICILLCSMPYI